MLKFEILIIKKQNKLPFKSKRLQNKIFFFFSDIQTKESFPLLINKDKGMLMWMVLDDLGT